MYSYMSYDGNCLYISIVTEPERVCSFRCFDYIEEMIHKQEPIEQVLRFLVLFSVTNSGLPKKNFDYLRQV